MTCMTCTHRFVLAVDRSHDGRHRLAERPEVVEVCQVVREGLDRVLVFGEVEDADLAFGPGEQVTCGGGVVVLVVLLVIKNDSQEPR